MARAALGWSLSNLADASHVNRRTILRHEAGQAIQPEKLEAMRAALVEAGAAFINGGGRIGVSVKRAD